MDSLAWLYSRAARSHARLIARLFVLDRSATATAASKPSTGGSETWHASTLRAEESDLWSLLAERLPAPLLDARIDGVPWEEYVAAVLLCVLLVSLVLPLSWRRALSRVRDGGKQTARGRRHQAARRHTSPVEPTTRERALSVQVEQLSVELARARSNKQSMISALEAQAESLNAELTRARASEQAAVAAAQAQRRRATQAQADAAAQAEAAALAEAAAAARAAVADAAAEVEAAEFAAAEAEARRAAAAVPRTPPSARRTPKSPASAPGGSRRRSYAWELQPSPAWSLPSPVSSNAAGARRPSFMPNSRRPSLTANGIAPLPPESALPDAPAARRRTTKLRVLDFDKGGYIN